MTRVLPTLLLLGLFGGLACQTSADYTAVCGDDQLERGEDCDGTCNKSIVTLEAGLGVCP